MDNIKKKLKQNREAYEAKLEELEEKELRKELEMFKKVAEGTMPIVDETLAKSKTIEKYFELLERIAVALEVIANKR